MPPEIIASNITQLLTQWSPVVSFLALFRPELTKLWCSIFLPFSIRIKQSGLLEIRSTNQGPQINALGTLISKNKDSYIETMIMRVVRESDKAEMNMDWHAARSPQLSGPFANVVQLAAVVKLGQNEACQYNHIFIDNKVKKKNAALCVSAKQNIERQILDMYKVNCGLNPNDEQKKELEPKRSQIYSAFQKSDTYAEILKTFDHDFFWRTGRYGLTLTVQTMNGNDTFSEKWNFVLTELDEQRLRHDAEKAVDDAVGIPNQAGYFSALVDYLPIEPNA